MRHEDEEADFSIMELLETVHDCRELSPFSITKVEEKYDAEFVGMFCVKTYGDNWSETPLSIFYQKKPPVEGYSNYFGLFVNSNGSAVITSGQSAIDPIIWGAVAHDGEIIYSSHRHDYRISKDGTAMIDGGRDYVKSSQSELIPMKIVDGKFFRIEFKPKKENLKTSKP